MNNWRVSMLGVSAAACIVTACGGGDNKQAATVDTSDVLVHKTSQTPRFITWEQRLKQRQQEAEAKNEVVAQAASDENRMWEAAIGDEQPVNGFILNEGPASIGVRILISGSAVQQGMVKAPKIEFSTYKDLKENKVPNGFGPQMGDIRGEPLAKESVKVTEGGGHSYTAVLPEIPYQSVMEYRIRLPIQGAGTGDVNVEFWPVTSGTSTAKITRHIMVRPDNEAPEHPPETMDSR